MSDESRTTYTERHAYSASVMKWRKAIYTDRDGMTNGCRVLLLRLSDDMNPKRVVSVPRSVLADDLGVAPARITEGIKKARALGFLDIVRRGRPGITATYQGIFPNAVATQNDEEDGTPERTSTWYATADHAEVRQGVPLDETTWYALPPTQEEVDAAGIEQVPDTDHRNGALEGRGSRTPLSLQGHAWVSEDCPHGIPETCTECSLTTDRASTNRRLA